MASNTTSSQAAHSAFPIPFTLEQMREDILKVYLLQARTTLLFVPDEVAWPIAGPERVATVGEVWNPDVSPEEMGLTYDAVQDTLIARALEQEYEFGFNGRLVPGVETMNYESVHMWVAAYLMDLNGSELVREWESYGVDVAEAIARCLHASELANARRVLEGGRVFSHFDSVGASSRTARQSDGDGATAFEGLTIRQMALLSGMEEMTIRTAASRQGPNMLLTFKDEVRRTLVKPEDAKRWLIAKGRYVAVTKGASTFDLAKTALSSVPEFNHYVRLRIDELESAGESVGQLRGALSRLIGPGELLQINDLTRDQLVDAELIGKLAPLLSVPAAVLVPRARQAALRDELAELEQQIRQVPATAAPEASPSA